MANGLSEKPAMGWNSWNHYACNISDSLIRETAKAIVDTGLAELGYTYINLDDCWQSANRNASGYIQPDRRRFPYGLKDLGDYIHSLGLKFGIYSSAGFRTCQSFPGSLGLEDIDAKSYAQWGVDFMKYDNCYSDYSTPERRFPPMGASLNATGRPMVYAICEWGRNNPAAWAGAISNQWRISADIIDKWESFILRVDIDAPLWRYAGSGGWNDPDMLEVGNGGCTYEEYKSHFSLWAILKAPLLIGANVRGLRTGHPTLRILGNKEVIDVNQDSLGRQARRVRSDHTNRKVDKYNRPLIATKCATGAPSAYEDDPLLQQWVVNVNGTVQNPASGLCLVEEGEGISQHTVRAGSCSTATTWDFDILKGTISSSSSGLGSGRCLEVAKFVTSMLAQGKRVQTGVCISPSSSSRYVDYSEHQTWTAPDGKLLNLYQRQCLTVDEDAPTGESFEIWTCDLTGHSKAILALNKVNFPMALNITSADIWGTHEMRHRHRHGEVPVRPVVTSVRDLWLHRELFLHFPPPPSPSPSRSLSLRTSGGNTAANSADIDDIDDFPLLTVDIPAHGVVMLKITFE
eukprot:gene3021-5920_t